MSGTVSPNTNSTDLGELIALVGSIDKFDVINDRCVSANANGSYFVEKVRGQLSLVEAARALLNKTGRV